MMNKRNRKGFTLAELLIVVAIVAVLTAIAIPVFTSQLEKSREATDLANIRSKYAEMMVAILDATGTDITGDTYKVNLKQTVADWQTPDAATTISDLGLTCTTTPSAGGIATLTYTAPTSTAPDGTFTITFSAGA